MAERVIASRTYGIVCIALIALTVLTIGVSFLPLVGIWHTVIGLIIAAGKGSLVLLFFMHVLHSPRLTWIVIGVTSFWVVVLFVLTLNDYFSRGMIAFTPRH